MQKTKPIVIAHRGASGYLPEHSLAAKALAHCMGADFLEQDVVLSKDGVPIVLHDIHLESTTDVEARFPRRARADGRYYAIDFNLDELQSLRLHERCHPGEPGTRTAVYPQRFPVQSDLFRIPTLAEEIALIAGLDRSRGCRTGLYVELKAPNWHLSEGKDLTLAVLEVLKSTGYAERTEQVYLQCFDDRTLRRLSEVLKSPLPLIQLIGENSWGEDDGSVDYDFLKSPDGLTYVASYAQGIGPFIRQIYLGKTASGAVQFSEMVPEARARGLQVHPYTFRRDDLPPGIDSFEELLDIFIRQAGVDGLFTDFPDIVVDYLRRG